MRIARRTSTKVALAAAAAVVVALSGFVFANRRKTRLRLSYPPGDVVVTRDVFYVAASTNPKHRLDVYAPKDAKNAPVVHFVHGGYWVEGDKDFYAFVSGLYGSVGQALARRGIVTVVQSYRLSPEASIDGILDDVKAAVRWTQKHAPEHGGDPKRVFLMGHSAGGHLVALAGEDETTKDVKGIIVLSGVWDVAGAHDAHGAQFNEEVIYPTFGRDREAWSKRSPLPSLHAGLPPFMIVIGEHDEPFMIPQAERARDRLTSLGATPRFVRLAGLDHAGVVLAFGSVGDPISDEVASFVK